MELSVSTIKLAIATCCATVAISSSVYAAFPAADRAENVDVVTAMVQPSAEALKHYAVTSFDVQNRYRIWVAKPKVFDKNQKLVYLYVIDANNQLSMAMDKLTKLNSPDNVVLVGVGYNTGLAENNQLWTQDLTFNYKDTRRVVNCVSLTSIDRLDVKRSIGLRCPDGYQMMPKDDPYEDVSVFIKGGGAAKFLKALKTEIIPRVEQQAGQGQRVISGANLGGLFTIYTYINDPFLFQEYISTSPSLWWRNGEIVSMAMAMEQKVDHGVYNDGKIVDELPPLHIRLTTFERSRQRMSLSDSHTTTEDLSTVFASFVPDFTFRVARSKVPDQCVNYALDNAIAETISFAKTLNAKMPTISVPRD